MFRILITIQLILSLLNLVTPMKIQYFKDFNSLNFNEVYDTKVIQNIDGIFAFVTFKTNKSQYKLSKFNLNQKPPKLFLDYVQPYYIGIKRNLLYLPTWGQISTYSLDQASHPYYNIKTGKYIASIPLYYRKAIASDVYKKIIFIDSFNTLLIIDKIESFLVKISIPIFLSKLPFQISAYSDIQMKLSQNQKYFGIVNKNLWINKVGIDIFDISDIFYKKINFIVPQQIKKVGGYIINSFSWKNSDVLFINYVFSGGLKDFANTILHHKLIFVLEKMQLISFNRFIILPYFKKLFYMLLTRNHQIILQEEFFLNQQNLSISSIINLTDANFQVKKIIFQWFNQSVILTQMDPKSALISKIINICDIDEYFDTCLNRCTTFHQNCTNFTQQGCNCQSSQYYQQYQQQIFNSLQQQIIQFNQNYSNVLQTILNYQFVIKFDQIPNLRGFFKPVHAFFINFADLYFYIYHERQYNYIINITLYSIKDLQQKKWNLFRLNQLQENILPNMTKYENFVSSKIQFTSNKFMYIENHSSQFLVHTQNFIFPTSVAIIFLFILLRGSFFALKKFQFELSKLFKQFQYWPYLVIILLDGNQLIFSYLFAFQLKWLFSINIITKIKSGLLILMFFLIYWFTSSSFFIFRYLYNKSSGKLFQNVRNTNLGAFHLITFKGIRYLLMGFIHTFINDTYEYKLFCLFLTQAIFLCEYIYIMKIKSVILIKILAWIQVQVGFIRLILIYNFSFDQNLIRLNPLTILLDSQISQKLIQIYFILTTTNSFLYILKFFVQILYSRRNFNKKKQLLKIFSKKAQKFKQDKISSNKLMRFSHIPIQKILKNRKDISIGNREDKKQNKQNKKYIKSLIKKIRSRQKKKQYYYKI